MFRYEIVSADTLEKARKAGNNTEFVQFVLGAYDSNPEAFTGTGSQFTFRVSDFREVYPSTKVTPSMILDTDNMKRRGYNLKAYKVVGSDKVERYAVVARVGVELEDSMAKFAKREVTRKAKLLKA